MTEVRLQPSGTNGLPPLRMNWYPPSVPPGPLGYILIAKSIIEQCLKLFFSIENLSDKVVMVLPLKLVHDL